MTNHLIIGLGGTGHGIMKAIRKRIAEEFHNDLSMNGVEIEYLYVDTIHAVSADTSLLSLQKIALYGVDSNVFDNLSLYPTIQSFITPVDKELLLGNANHLNNGFSGQKRRLGRLLLANNILGLHDGSFTARLRNSVLKLIDRSKKEEVTFHICSGLAGGVGSGSIIDIIAQIRKQFDPRKSTGNRYKLYLYLNVPEGNMVDPMCNAGYYQANSYAALSELNAISIGVYKPCDLDSHSKREDGKVERLLGGCNAFEMAYLFTNSDEDGRQQQFDSKISASVADFLFQKIYVHMHGLLRMEEFSFDDIRNDVGTPILSNSFSTFGIKRIDYPELEIEKYVTYSFVRQAILQSLYDNWNHKSGFEELSFDEVNIDIVDEKIREEFLLADRYLILSTPLIYDSTTKKWKEIAPEWETWIQLFADDIQTGQDKKKWLSDFNSYCDLQYHAQYRGSGVKEFYKIQINERWRYADYIRQHIEEKLFNGWRSGAKSLLEIVKFLHLLIEDCDKRIPEFQKKIEDFEYSIQHEIIPEIELCEKEWKKVGWLINIIGSPYRKIFLAYKMAKGSYYELLTLTEGYQYAISLISLVKSELARILETVKSLYFLISEILIHIETELDKNCKHPGEFVKICNPEWVKNLTKQFVSDELVQKHNASLARNGLAELLGTDGKRGFTNMLDKLDMVSIEDTFIQVCLTTASSVMADLEVTDPTQKIIDVNILEKIKKSYTSDEQLEELIQYLVQSSQSYLQFNSEEVDKLAMKYGIPLRHVVQLSLPEYYDATNFRQKFIDMFKKACPKFSVHSDLLTNYKRTELVVVNATVGFPLSIVANIETLKDRYNEMLNGSEAALHKMMLHTESDILLPNLLC
ncbi:tubulin-like doman-containing protein [Bacteroides sp. 224]|uniref:tubulin-like doman-containing protein n=1 Tax=Bacteroides sp. 224 TaxID=2302936 RepID=UPI0013D49D59|nr:tubulin-like doman-containing protein [Bacteroides sp. 224]NDV65269.1 hypothetical protein [Bacteroides sp. 224]